jgi:hypothetical protein
VSDGPDALSPSRKESMSKWRLPQSAADFDRCVLFCVRAWMCEWWVEGVGVGCEDGDACAWGGEVSGLVLILHIPVLFFFLFFCAVHVCSEPQWIVPG